jgi:sugar porter (SP) family MFS transporter
MKPAPANTTVAGYDTGVMSSVLALKAFKKDFGLPTESSGFATKQNAHVSQNVVSLLTAGCFFGALAAAYVNEKFGRKKSLIAFTIIFLIGAAVQTASHHSIGQIYAGRVIAGLGIGGMSSITPVFVAENCPPAVRGRITGLFQEFLVIGSTFAYWLDYGVALTIPESTKQWRTPVAIQLIPGGALLIGVFFLTESPRWLAKQGRYEEATKSLAYMRRDDVDDPDIIKEIADIRASIEEELHLTEGVTWRECLVPGNRYRFGVAFVIFLCQQFSGTNSIGKSACFHVVLVLVLARFLEHGVFLGARISASNIAPSLRHSHQTLQSFSMLIRCRLLCSSDFPNDWCCQDQCFLVCYRCLRHCQGCYNGYLLDHWN